MRIAIALGVFGTLSVEKVISSGGTALAVAAEPTLGKAGDWLMSVTALFATAGATNALVLALAIGAAAVVLVTFVFTSLIHEPASIVTLLAVLAVRRGRGGRIDPACAG
jgi:hypothetical protein